MVGFRVFLGRPDVKFQRSQTSTGNNFVEFWYFLGRLLPVLIFIGIVKCKIVQP